jgi:pimeloyl-ACP methyl ester carboxylesterase
MPFLKEPCPDRLEVVAIDQRGYNLSDKPKGVESYEKATIVGHDWGGAVAWQFALKPGTGWRRT